MLKAVMFATIFMLVPSLVLAHAQPVASDVTFKGASDFELHGTLVLPVSADQAANRAKVPAVLLLPGSGPTNRDGNQPPVIVTDLLKQIADKLAAEGIASFRFDKRATHVYREQWPKNETELGAFFSYENFVANVTQAYRFLRAQERIDPSRIAILGHSEGGLFALQVAHDLAASDERPAGLILAGTAGRSLDDVLREQIRSLLETQTQDQALRDSFLTHLDQGIAAIEKKQPIPADMPPGLLSIFNPSTQQLLYAYFTVDPAVLAADVRGPVLVLQGQRDAQISPDRDARRLEEALAKRDAVKDGVAFVVEIAILPDTSHNLKKVEGDGELGFAGPVVPEALDRIVEWCRKHLQAAK